MARTPSGPSRRGSAPGRSTDARGVRRGVPDRAAVRDGHTGGGLAGGEPTASPNREIALEELLLLWLANANPAFAPFQELFDDAPLAADRVRRT